MAEIVRMPKMSDTMEEGVLVKWLKKEGDTLTTGDILAEVETDKAVMELENYEEGTLLHVAIQEGEKVPVNALIAVVGDAGEDFKALLKTEAATPTQTDPSQEAAQTQPPVPDGVKDSSTPAPAADEVASISLPSSTETPDSRLKTSPLARKIAKEKGYDLSRVQGSGDGGRIIKRDILAHRPSPVADMASLAAAEQHSDMPVSQMRKIIAARLVESKHTAPHFYLRAEVEVSKLVQARTRLNAHASSKISFNDLIIKATAQALTQHPIINSSWQGEYIRQYEHIHIGVAVAVPDGLLVPVIRFANLKGLMTLSAEMKQLAAQARDRTLQPEQWEGGTFSISNLGMYGIESFTAIINPPNAAILAIGGISNKPVMYEEQIVPGKVMQLTLSCDHRVVDGAAGAAFLQTLQTFLSDPLHMLL